ncbi:MAG: CPBP family glutamic-type intramembrane protease [Nitrospira sp.]
MRTATIQFSLVVLGFYLLLWGAQLLFPGGSASTVALLLTILVGIGFVQPGWNIRPSGSHKYWVVLIGVLLGSAVLAAWVLRLCDIPTPYNTIMPSDIVAYLPGIMAVTGVEELLFRQVAFSWLERQHTTGTRTVVSTALAFGGAHLGPLFVGGEVAGIFYLLQSLYMVWVGLLLGELRRASHSWVMSWTGHVTYNVSILLFLSIK